MFTNLSNKLQLVTQRCSNVSSDNYFRGQKVGTQDMEDVQLTSGL